MRLHDAVSTLGFCFVICDSALALTPKNIFDQNAAAILYVAVKPNGDAGAGEVSRGTGFIVSHDGYVVTAAHLSPGPNEHLEGTIGGREGVIHTLTPVESDDTHDITSRSVPLDP